MNKKLAKPTPQQLAWQDSEMGMFCHFGLNTFTTNEWGKGDDSPKIFNPVDFDARQWAETAKKAGCKYLMLTAKHHDGFCLWQTETTDYSVKSSPWRDGKGDVVRECAEACREFGIKFGVYLSPWDMHEKTYGTPAYNDYFCNQLTELLTNYGEISEVWFDGAKGANARAFEYDWSRYYSLIRTLQPKANIAVCGPDIRWVGNEGGKTRKSEFSVVPSYLRLSETVSKNSQHNENDAKNLKRLTSSDEDLGSRSLLKECPDLCWYPAEVDVSIRKGWFYSKNENKTVKGVNKLFKIYLNSVGNNCTLLLNVPPTDKGVIHRKDARVLKSLGSKIDEMYAYPIIVERLGRLQEDDGYIDFEFDSVKQLKYVVISEDIRFSQRVEAFDIYIKKPNGKYIKVYSSTVIGSKKIAKIKNKKCIGARFVIRQSRSTPVISEIGFYE